MIIQIDAALTGCDKEPVQFIGSIQPTGSLVATDPNGIIRYAALAPTFCLKTSEILGKPLGTLLGKDLERVIGAVQEREEPTSPILIKSDILGGWLTCIAHKQADFTVFELELAQAEEVLIAPLQFMKQRQKSLGSYLSSIVKNLQQFTGYDRVMIYRFAPDWHGEVVAESVAARVPSFYRYHFPASDIPDLVREMFKKLWVRSIADVDAVCMPLVSESDSQLDLTQSVLRASSPVHLEYLRNMGVKGSLTLSLICDGRLWGLIACHHLTPKYVAAEERSLASLLAKMISARITALSLIQSIDAGKRVSEFTSALELQLQAGQLQEGQLLDCIRDHKHNLLSLVPCDGFSYVSESSTLSNGSAVTPQEAKTIARLFDVHGADVLSVNSLTDEFPDAPTMSCAGVLGVKIDTDWCLWTRKEQLTSVLWAGDPNESVYSDDKSQKLSPRSSFRKFKETVRGKGLPWQQTEIDCADNLRHVILDAIGKSPGESRLEAGKFAQRIQFEIKRDVADLQQNFKELSLEPF